MKSVKTFLVTTIISALLITAASLFAYVATTDGIIGYNKENCSISLFDRDIKINEDLISLSQDYASKLSAFFDYVTPKYIDIPIKKAAAALCTATVNTLKSIGSVLTMALIQNT